MALPRELYDRIWPQVQSNIGTARYYRVIMSLFQVLEGDFFNVYLKTGEGERIYKLALRLRTLSNLR